MLEFKIIDLQRRVISERGQFVSSSQEDEAADLKDPLLVCLNCRNFSERLVFLSRFARRYGNDDPPP